MADRSTDNDQAESSVPHVTQETPLSMEPNAITLQPAKRKTRFDIPPAEHKNAFPTAGNKSGEKATVKGQEASHGTTCETAIQEPAQGTSTIPTEGDGHEKVALDQALEGEELILKIATIAATELSTEDVVQLKLNPVNPTDTEHLVICTRNGNMINVCVKRVSADGKEESKEFNLPWNT